MSQTFNLHNSKTKTLLGEGLNTAALDVFWVQVMWILLAMF